MQIITGVADSLPVQLLRELALYRHRVFVEMLGWDLAVQDGMELDQFDRPGTLYVIARGQEGGNGCPRTTRGFRRRQRPARPCWVSRCQVTSDQPS